MKKITVKVRKPSTGTDCRISSAGMRTRSALLLLAASGATRNVNKSEKPSAANILRVVSSAYCGRFQGSSETGCISRLASG